MPSHCIQCVFSIMCLLTLLKSFPTVSPAYSYFIQRGTSASPNNHGKPTDSTTITTPHTKTKKNPADGFVYSVCCWPFRILDWNLAKPNWETRPGYARLNINVFKIFLPTTPSLQVEILGGIIYPVEVSASQKTSTTYMTTETILL